MKRKMSRLRWHGMKLMALGTVAAYSTAALGADAKVEQPADPAGSGAPQAQAPVQRFNIPAGTLEDALAAYTTATGVQVELKLPQGDAASLQSAGVRGVLSNEAALRVLLQESGLNYRFRSAQRAEVSVHNAETVNVTASALPDAVAMDKFTEPLLDTAQSVTVVPQFVMHDEGISTLRDTLRNVPGISIAAGEGGSQGDNLTIRGFTARNDVFLDGIRDFGSYYRDSFNYEQVDVLEGPAGVQFGRGATGGVINQESKAPQARDLMNINAQFGSDLTRRLTMDVNEPMSDLAKGSALRVNAMAQEGGVAGRDYAEVRRFGLAPSVEFGMNSPTRLTLSYFHLTESDTPDYGLPWLIDKLVQGAPHHSYFGFPDSNYLRTNDDIVTAKLEHDINEHARLHSTARWANYPRAAQITEPQICSNPALSVPVGGYVAALPTSAVNSKQTCSFNDASDPATIVVNRNQIQTKSVEGDLWDQTEGIFRFTLLRLQHDLVAGIEGGQEVSNPIRTSYTLNSINTVPSATLINPYELQPFAGTGYITSIVHTKAESVGLYFVDTVKLSRLFELSGGVRWDRFDMGYNSYQPTPPAGGTASAASSFSRVDAQPSYRAAFVYKPGQHGSVYFDYGTSFDPSAEALSLSAGSANLPPEENETYEGGVKWNFFHEKLLLEGAVFRTEKDNAKETDPTNSNNIVLSGNQLVKGVQLSAVGRLPEGMNIVAGYAYLDSAVISSIFYPTSIGYPLANVPRQTFNLFVTHRLPLLFNVGVGGNYVGSRTASSTVPYVPTAYGAAQMFAAGSAPCGATATVCYPVTATAMKQVPGYWVFNAMLRRPLTDHLELQANVYNALNRFYIDQPHPSHLIPGAGASALIGFSYKF